MSAPVSHLHEHIETIAKHEEEFLARRTASERIGDVLGTLIGSLSFVIFHAVLFGAWILVNLSAARNGSHFDPSPFPLLATVVAMEAIFLASFILMRQSRISRRSEERDHLILQILLLTEKEITAVLGIQREMAARMGMQEVAKDATVEQLSREISIDEVAHTLQEQLPLE